MKDLMRVRIIAAVMFVMVVIPSLPGWGEAPVEQAVQIAVEPPPGWEPPRRPRPEDEEEDDDEDEGEDIVPDFTGEDLPSCNAPCTTVYIKGKTFEVLSITSATMDYPQDPSTDPMQDDVHIDPDAEMEPVESTRQTHRRAPHSDVRKAIRELRRGQLNWSDIEFGQCVVDESDQNQTVERTQTFFDPSKTSQVLYRKECQCVVPSGATQTPAGTRDETWVMTVPFWDDAGFAYLRDGHTGGEITPDDLIDIRGNPGVTLRPNQKLGEREPAMGRVVIPILVKKQAEIRYKVTRDLFEAQGTCTTRFVLDSIFLTDPDSEQDDDTWTPDQSDDPNRVTPNTPPPEYISDDAVLDQWKLLAKQPPFDRETGMPLDGTVIVVPRERTPLTDVPVTDDSDVTTVAVFTDEPQLDGLQPGDTIVVTAKCHQKKSYVVGRDPVPKALVLDRKPIKFTVANGDSLALNQILKDLAAKGIHVVASSVQVNPQGEYAEVIISRYTTADQDCPKIPRCCGSGSALQEGQPGWYQGSFPRHGFAEPDLRP